VVVDPPWLRDYTGTFLLSFGDSCVVSVPSSREAAVREAVAGRAAPEVFDRDFAGGLGESGWVVLGPSQHAYVDRAVFDPVAAADARQLGADDTADIAAFEAAVGAADWSEAGFGDHEVHVMWGISRDGVLASMGNMTDWDGRPADVGVVTHPEHRGRGLASSIASAMTAAALEQMDVVRYRALAANAASLRVASRLGFVPYGRNMAVRPPR
jgi:RimJ/RimL family protein N-acetyltransferase